MKALSDEAIKIRTRDMTEIPDGREFRGIVDDLRDEPRFGGRVMREAYEREIQERDRIWLDIPDEAGDADLEKRFEKRYRAEKKAWKE